MKPKLRFSNFINDYEIKDVSDITSNISSGKISKQLEDGEYNVYGSMGIIGKSNFYDYAGEKVLVARVGANAGSVNKINEKCCISDNTLVLEPKDILNDYLYYALSHYNPKKLIFGSGQPLVTGGQLKKIKLGIPSKEEQLKVSNFLSLLDKKIELQSKKIEDLKLFKLKSFEIMIREINEYKKIKQIGSLKNGYSFKNNLYDGKGLYNILTISNVTGNLYINNNFKNKYNFIPKDIQNHQILKEKDILISMTGNVGRVSFNKGKNNLLNQRVGVLELNESINRDYIFYMLSNKKFENKMIDCGQGAAQLNITKTDIENYKIPYPNKQKQLKITKILNYITQKIQLEENKLLKLKELKNGLMQNMFV